MSSSVQPIQARHSAAICSSVGHLSTASRPHSSVLAQTTRFPLFTPCGSDGWQQRLLLPPPTKRRPNSDPVRSLPPHKSVSTEAKVEAIEQHRNRIVVGQSQKAALEYEAAMAAILPLPPPLFAAAAKNVTTFRPLTLSKFVGTRGNGAFIAEGRRPRPSTMTLTMATDTATQGKEKEKRRRHSFSWAQTQLLETQFRRHR